MSPAMPKADPETLERFLALVPDDPRVAVKPMFGHRAAFVNGNMFFGTFGHDLILRLPAPEREELLRQGAAIFAPMAGRPMKEYVMLPHAWQRQLARLRPWI